MNINEESPFYESNPMIDAFSIGRNVGILKFWYARYKLQQDDFSYTSQVMLRNAIQWLLSSLKDVNILEETQIELESILDEILKLEEKGKELRKKTITQVEYENDTALMKMNILMGLDMSIPIWDDRIYNHILSIQVLPVFTDTTLNPDKLSKGAYFFLDESIWNKLLKIQKEDLNDACKCLTIQAWTPAAMITMRAVEAAIRVYYKKLTDISKKVSWGNIITELKSLSQTDSKLLGYLEYLKDIRNKLQHPDVRFTQEEAEEIFHQALHIIRIINL